MVAGPSPADSTTAAAPAPDRVSNGVPGPGTTASDTTTSATRADPAATASAAASSASIPACVEPLHSAPDEFGDRPTAAARSAWLGPSANGGPLVPHQSPATVAPSIPAAVSARPAASAAGAQTAARPRPPPRPQAAPTSAASRRRPAADAPTETIRAGELRGGDVTEPDSSVMCPGSLGSDAGRGVFNS